MGSVDNVLLSSDGQRAYLATNTPSRLEIIDISNPDSLSTIGYYQLGESMFLHTASNMAISPDEQRMYITDTLGYLNVIDVHDPAAMRSIGQYNTGGVINDIAISSDEQRAYIASDSGLKVMDITLDRLFKVKDFGDDTLDFTIYSKSDISANLELSTDRDDIVTVGEYTQEVQLGKDQNPVISVPIHSVAGGVGETIITATLSYGNHKLERKIHLKVYDRDTTPPTAPTLTIPLPSETTDSMVTVEVNGEIDSVVYVNGTAKGVIGSQGKVIIPVGLNWRGANSFSFTLKDSAGNESEALNATVIWNIQTLGTLLKKTGQIKSYETNGNEVLNGTLKDDGYYQSGITPSYTRDDIQEIVIDNITGLMWQDDEQVSNVTKPWLTVDNYQICLNDHACFDTSGDTATTFCEELSLGGYDDWRLPTIEELEGIIDYGVKYPTSAIDYTFQNIAAYPYWSATSKVDEKQYAWDIENVNNVTRHITKENDSSIRCVRENIKE